MFDHLLFAAAVGSGLVAGVFFAFSNFVMPALGRLPPHAGAAAMNAINITAINPAFMLALFGTGVLCLAIAAGAFPAWQQPGAQLALIAAACYVAGCVGVTMLGNVPLNNALAAATPGSPESAELWLRYLRDWTFRNHVRTGASLLAAILFIAARIYR